MSSGRTDEITDVMVDTPPAGSSLLGSDVPLLSADPDGTQTDNLPRSDEIRAGGMSALPKNIGPYHIVSQLGEGGMDIVYQAEQHHPIRRKVAVKVVRAEIGSSNVIARFEAERQALARMDHPHIAKVLDVGTDNYGRPYFVMELVPGIHL